MQVNIFEAKSRLSQLIQSAHAGEDVVIANRGRPVARLQALTHGQAAGPGARSAAQPGGFAAWLEHHPLPAYARRSAAAIDADIAGERAAWD